MKKDCWARVRMLALAALIFALSFIGQPLPSFSQGVPVNLGHNNSVPPTLGTCTSGAIVTGSVDTSGSVTGNASTSCAVAFGTAFAVAPVCYVSLGVGSLAVAETNISAIATTGFTVTSSSGNIVAMQWLCLPRGLNPGG